MNLIALWVCVCWCVCLFLCVIFLPLQQSLSGKIPFFPTVIPVCRRDIICTLWSSLPFSYLFYTKNNTAIIPGKIKSDWWLAGKNSLSFLPSSSEQQVDRKRWWQIWLESTWGQEWHPQGERSISMYQQYKLCYIKSNSQLADILARCSKNNKSDWLKRNSIVMWLGK